MGLQQQVQKSMQLTPHFEPLTCAFKLPLTAAVRAECMEGLAKSLLHSDAYLKKRSKLNPKFRLQLS